MVQFHCKSCLLCEICGGAGGHRRFFCFWGCGSVCPECQALLTSALPPRSDPAWVPVFPDCHRRLQCAWQFGLAGCSTHRHAAKTRGFIPGRSMDSRRALAGIRSRRALRGVWSRAGFYPLLLYDLSGEPEQRKKGLLEEHTGLEPAKAAWKAAVLPLHQCSDYRFDLFTGCSCFQTGE